MTRRSTDVIDKRTLRGGGMADDSGAAQVTFLRLGTLVYDQKKPIGLIATAIERHGVHTWDRFGRRRLYSPGTEECTKALDLLAAAYAARIDPDGDDEWEFFSDAGGDAFGWPSNAAPDFKNLKKSIKDELEKPIPRHAIVKTDNANILIIGALLAYIKGELGNSQHPNFESEDQLSLFIDQKFKGYSGASQRSLKTKFARAKEALKTN